jgi:hypothetical protein
VPVCWKTTKESTSSINTAWLKVTSQDFPSGKVSAATDIGSVKLENGAKDPKTLCTVLAVALYDIHEVGRTEK